MRGLEGGGTDLMSSSVLAFILEVCMGIGMVRQVERRSAFRRAMVRVFRAELADIFVLDRFLRAAA